MFVALVFYFGVCLLSHCVSCENARYFHLPMHEVMQYPVYLGNTGFQEIVVTYGEKGSDLRKDDYLTHADGIRVLNGGLDAFLKNGEKEAILPIVDEHDSKYDGSRLLGFVHIQIVSPRKLSTRRGEIVYDMEEGGPPPTMKLGNVVIGPDGSKTTNDPSYVPPAFGGGACITGRDCFFFNGTCTAGQCGCIGAYTGSFCQVSFMQCGMFSDVYMQYSFIVLNSLFNRGLS
jgi:hypothetical protein